MPLINGTKFACNSCIKGHRSSHCNHVERPLFEIRRKGRPVTQCAYCRDLRKTKQVHVKCVCGDRKVVPPRSADVSQPPSKMFSSTTAGSSTRSFSPPQAESLFLDTRVSAADNCSTSAASAAATMGGGGVEPTTASSFSWAWISPQPPPQQHLGFVFQKPQEEADRVVAMTPSTSSTAAMTTRPFRQISPGPTPHTSTLGHQQHQQQHFAPTPTPSTGLVGTTAASLPPPTAEDDPMVQQLLNSLMGRPAPVSTIATSAATTATFSPPSPLQQPVLPQQHQHHPPPPPPPSTMCRGGCCACPPAGALTQGESVVITITPLPKQHSASPQDHTTPAPPTTMTRVVTCYCGPSCICPDCLVHPGNSFLANMDPYAGLMNAHQSPTSSSSSCGSDDD